MLFCFGFVELTPPDPPQTCIHAGLDLRVFYRQVAFEKVSIDFIEAKFKENVKIFVFWGRGGQGQYEIQMFVQALSQVFRVIPRYMF